MTMVFSGPMDLYQVAAYEPAAGGYARVAYWDRCTTDGLAFVGQQVLVPVQRLRPELRDRRRDARERHPGAVRGALAPGVGVNVMSTTLCTGHDRRERLRLQPRPRAARLQGGRGGEQDLRHEVPHAARRRDARVLDPPGAGRAVGAVRVQLPRRRGARADAASSTSPRCSAAATANPAHPEQATTTIYSFQGVTNGGTSYFQRPVYETATFVVIFDAPSRSIAMRRLGATDFDFASALPASVVSDWLAHPGTSRAMPEPHDG